MRINLYAAVMSNLEVDLAYTRIAGQPRRRREILMCIGVHWAQESRLVKAETNSEKIRK